jgi:hypothetical protein
VIVVDDVAVGRGHDLVHRFVSRDDFKVCALRDGLAEVIREFLARVGQWKRFTVWAKSCRRSGTCTSRFGSLDIAEEDPSRSSHWASLAIKSVP